MKIILLLLCIVFAGCGKKSNEEIAKDLIKENLKTSLPDFKAYESVNFGGLGTAFMAYEETEGYINYLKTLNARKDSVTSLEKMIGESTASPAGKEENKKKLQEMLDSIRVMNERNSAGKQAYVPGKMFKMSHAYTLKDNTGLDKKTESEFYLDKELTRVVKVHKVY